MGLRDFVEPGRVCFINFGEDYGKMVVIVDFVDINRVMVDGMSAFPRTIYPLKRLTLTKLKVNNILKGARTRTIKKEADKQEITASWKKTPAFAKMDRANKRANLNDFERFQVMVLRRQRNYDRSHLNSKKKKAPAKKEAPKAEGAKEGGKKKKGKK